MICTTRRRALSRNRLSKTLSAAARTDPLLRGQKRLRSNFKTCRSVSGMYEYLAPFIVRRQSDICPLPRHAR